MGRRRTIVEARDDLADDDFDGDVVGVEAGKEFLQVGAEGLVGEGDLGAVLFGDEASGADLFVNRGNVRLYL